MPPDQHVEYPVVLGEVMQFFALIARRLAPGNEYEQGVWFYDLTVILLGLCLVIGASQRSSPSARRPVLNRHLIRQSCRKRKASMTTCDPRFTVTV
ncbi:hypothetical protein ACIBH1_48800 [Nonomuraea sp. NPDC050663]|uniref:hypothetical protein n=1 Tax=Nonomuraea sp. NPDC050663 TaxID=3364370 RepID=UPI0037AEE708